MDNQTMYDTLLQLPLFQGLKINDITSILSKTTFQFMRFRSGECFIKKGTPNNKIFFLLQGSVVVTTESADRNFIVSEVINTLSIFEPQSFFGMDVNYKSSYTARTPVSGFFLEKKYFLQLMEKYEVFRISFMNIICNRIQNLTSSIWSSPAISLDKKILSFFLSHCQYSDSEVTVKVKMTDLGDYVAATRLNVSNALKSLKEKGFIVGGRTIIILPDIKKIADYLSAE